MGETSKDRQRYLVLTCDTEAMPAAASSDHVERLIWGRFPNAPRDAGIGQMMDIADAHGVKMTFFLDIAERTRYGEAIDRVARTILERGHDLELHLHVEFLPPDFWSGLGYRDPTWAMNQFNEEAARRVIEYARSAMIEAAGREPCAYRAGAFRYNEWMLRAVGDAGIKLSFDYYPITALKTAYHHGPDAGVLPVFRWSNGVIEVPVGCIENPNPLDTLDRYAGFESVMTLGDSLEYLERFWENGPEHRVLVLVLHGWSFLRPDRAGHYVWEGSAASQTFDAFLGGLPEDVRVVSARELLEIIERGEIAPAFEMPLAVAGSRSIPLYDLPPEGVAAESIPETAAGRPPLGWVRNLVRRFMEKARR